jgi:Ankyrin repeats (3 copies)
MLVLAALFVSPLFAQDKNAALREAVSDKNIDAIKAAIAAGADVNAQDEDGQVVLMTTQDVDVARALIAAGAKVDIANKYGMNALAAAAATANAPMVKLLIESKANVNYVDASGGIMLENAIAGKDPAIVKMLLDAGAKITPKKKQDIIDEAAMSGSDEIRAMIGKIVGKKIAAKEPPAPPAAPEPKPVDAKTAYNMAQPIAAKWQSDAQLFSLTALGDFGNDGRAAQWMADFYSPSAKKIERVMVMNGEPSASDMPTNELSDLVTVTPSTMLDTDQLNAIANEAGGAAYTSRHVHPSVALIHNPVAGDVWYFNYTDPDTQRIALTVVIDANTGKVSLKDGR